MRYTHYQKLDSRRYGKSMYIVTGSSAIAERPRSRVG